MLLNSGLYGPRALTVEGVGELVKIGPGAYALGAANRYGGLNVAYVGRADYDLISRLCDHVDAGEYTHFKHAFYDTRVSAYRKECSLFHMFGAYALDNVIHPASPKGLNLSCSHPACKRR